MIPFAGGALNAFETSYFITVFCLFLCALYYFSLNKSRPFVYIFLAASSYTVFQLAFDAQSLFNIVKQLRYFMPFFVATILLAVAPKKIYLKKTLYFICWAVLVSAASSLVMHFFFQEALIRIVQGSSDSVSGDHLALLIRSGRSPWGNVSLVFITIIALGYIHHFSRRKQLVIKLSVVISLLAALATLSRTVFIGLALIALFAPLVYYQKTAKKITYYFRMAFVLSFMIVSIVGLSLVNERFGKSLAMRFAINIGVSEVVDSAITGNRDMLYAQYSDRLINNLPLGQGLGKPYAVIPDRGVAYTVDNSYLSFMLPFGLIGLLVFFVFLFQIRKLMGPRCASQHLERFRKFMLLIIAITLIIALNVDLFSRNNFVIFITLIALAFANTRRLEEKKEQAVLLNA